MEAVYWYHRKKKLKLCSAESCSTTTEPPNFFTVKIFFCNEPEDLEFSISYGL